MSWQTRNKAKTKKRHAHWRSERVHEQRARGHRDGGRASSRRRPVSAREISNGRCASAKLESRRFCRIELELLGGKNDHFAVGR